MGCSPPRTQRKANRMRPQRPCLGLPDHPCGALTRNPAGRCRPCEQAHQRARNRRRHELYGGPWQATSRRARAEQPWCSICGRGADEVQLALDHEHGQVECVPCNSSHRRNP